MTDIEAVSLDLDDTLWELAPVIRRAEAVMADWLVQHHPAVAAQFSPADMHALRPLMLARHPARRYDVSFLRRATLRHCFEAAGCPVQAADEAFAVFLAARNQVELFDDVLPALDALAGRFRLVAVTNGNADVGAIGLGHYFHAVVTAAEVAAAKPQAAIFDAARVRAGLASPAHMVHVGDDPEADVAGALGAGMRAVWMNRRQEVWPGGTATTPADTAPARDARQHQEVSTLTELVALLEAAGR